MAKSKKTCRTPTEAQYGLYGRQFPVSALLQDLLTGMQQDIMEDSPKTQNRVIMAAKVLHVHLNFGITPNIRS